MDHGRKRWIEQFQARSRLQKGTPSPYQAQVFNVANHANHYVQNGNDVNQVQYPPVGGNCGDGISRKPDLLSATRIWF